MKHGNLGQFFCPPSAAGRENWPFYPAAVDAAFAAATQLDEQNRAKDASFEGGPGHLFGNIDTREKFVDNRLELALPEWAR